MSEQLFIGLIQSVIAGVALIGIYFAFLQANESKKANNSIAILKLQEHWSSFEIYQSVNYIHNLRVEWKTKTTDLSKWDALAVTWVKQNKPQDGVFLESWNKRRCAAQFLNQMEVLLRSKYIKPDDFFRIVPETARLLIVLIPIEKAIMAEFENNEIPINNWDKPVAKPLERLMTIYEAWFESIKKDFSNL